MLGFALQGENIVLADAVTCEREPVLGLLDEALVRDALRVDLAQIGAAREAQKNGLQDRIVGILNVAAVEREFQRLAQQPDAAVDRLAPECDESRKDRSEERRVGKSVTRAGRL